MDKKEFVTSIVQDGMLQGKDGEAVARNALAAWDAIEDGLKGKPDVDKEPVEKEIHPAIEAARYLKGYCKEHNCDGCPFDSMEHTPTGCTIAPNYSMPDDWEV